MQLRDLRRAGHAPSLVAALSHFEVSFMCWVLLGALGIAISTDLALSPWQKGLVVGCPLVSGSLFRLIVGPSSDRFGPRIIGTITLLVTAVAVAWGWLGATSLPELLGVGFLLGVAGSSFAVALPLAGRAFPPHLRGLVMGIAGAGNSGTVISALLAPKLATSVGWHGVLGLALLPIAFVLIVFRLMTRSTPAVEAPTDGGVRSVWGSRDARSLCALYLVTFGGFVGLISFLPILLKDTYGMSAGWASVATAVAAAAGSGLRPVGGAFADRLTGERVLPLVFGIAAVAMIAIATLPAPLVAVALFVVLIGALGAGNGAVFQIVPRLFPSSIGAVTGLVGAAGGIGGFMLPFGLGVTKSWTGSYAPGLVVVAAACLGAWGSLALAGRRWRAPVALAEAAA